jgi:Zn-dependent peptidase ImmA (M78 family)
LRQNETTKQSTPKTGDTYDPYAHAAQLGIEVIDRPIRTANGLWIPDHNVIVLRSGMKAVWQRSTLAHELGHVNYGHTADSPKHEVQADRYAAENLIEYEHILELMEWTPDPARLAMELGVTGRLLRVYLNVHRLAS